MRRHGIGDGGTEAQKERYLQVAELEVDVSTEFLFGRSLCRIGCTKLRVQIVPKWQGGICPDPEAGPSAGAVHVAPSERRETCSGLEQEARLPPGTTRYREADSEGKCEKSSKVHGGQRGACRGRSTQGRCGSMPHVLPRPQTASPTASENFRLHPIVALLPSDFPNE